MAAVGSSERGTNLYDQEMAEKTNAVAEQSDKSRQPTRRTYKRQSRLC